MTPQEKQTIVERLEKSRSEVNAAAEGIPASHENKSPGEGRWSALDCVEHIAFVEGRFLGWLENAEKVESPQVSAEKEAELASRIVNRMQKAEAPEAARPAGRFATLAEALAHFNSERARTIQFAEAKSAELYLLAAKHPRFGPVNGYELLLIVEGHARRHADQVREIRAQLGI